MIPPSNLFPMDSPENRIGHASTNNDEDSKGGTTHMLAAYEVLLSATNSLFWYCRYWVAWMKLGNDGLKG